MEFPESITRAQLAAMFAVIGLDIQQLTYATFDLDALTVTYVSKPVEIANDAVISHTREIPYRG